MNIGKAIYGILSGTTAVTDIVGTKIFPEIAEQETAVPFVIYQVQSVQPEDTHDGPSKLDEVRVEVLCYDDGYNGAADLASAVRGALDRVRGTYNGVNVESVQFNDVDFEIEYDPRRYSQVLTFTFRIKRDDIEIALGTPITGAQLGDLSDVNVTGVTDNQILSYDAATDTWVPAADAGGPDVLDDLSDVDTGEPQDGQMLAYQQGTWSAIYQDEIVLPILSVTGLQTQLNTIPDELDDLDDVKIVGTPAEGDALVYQSGFWSRGTAGASTLGDLDDVNTAGAGFGSTIVYNGSTWEISGSELPSDDIYYHNRYLTEAGTLRSGATETVELYYTAQADGDGLSESASSDTPTSGYDIRRKLWYAEKAQADPDTGTWTQFTAITDNTTFANAKAALLAYLKERTGGTVPISLKMTWEEVAQAPAFTGLLNESYGSGAEAAYSTRRLNGNVTDCMVIRRASDSTTTTIGFVDGDIDEAAIETFCTGTSCTVYQWLDQSGNGNDATAAAPANEPTIYTAGALIKEGGRLALEFDGVSDYLTFSNFDFASGVFAFNIYALNTSPTTSDFWHSYFVKNTAGNRAFGLEFSGNTSYDTKGAIIGNKAVPNDTVLVNTNQHLNTNFYDGAGTAATDVLMWEDGQSLSLTGVQNWNAIGGDSAIGWWTNGDASQYYDGKHQELIFYASDKSSDRTSIESNIGDYFTQNTPLLDTYSGAAAAYSLRKLRTAYTGDAVEVYNGSSYADIGFNVFGELDTVALAAHCGASSGYVSKWYDQSGNTNTATQATTSNMPKIYDGTTGIVTENGKPAVDFDGSDDFFESSTFSISNGSLAAVFVFRADSVGTYCHSQNGTVRGAYASGDHFFTHLGTTPNVTRTNLSGPTGQALIGWRVNDGTTDLYENGTSVASESYTGSVTTGTTGLDLMQRNNNSSRINGTMQEVIYFGTNKGADMPDIQSAVNNYYSIY